MSAPRKNKIDVPEIVDTEPRRSDVYFGSLIERFFTQFEKKRTYTATRYNRKHRLSLKNVSKLTGIPWESLMNYFTRRNVPIPIDRLDKILWATKISVLDLLDPQEIISYVLSMSYEERRSVSVVLKRVLDTMAQKAHDESSVDSADSQ